VFQKPYEGKPVESIVETGAGALNIDGGRISIRPDETVSRDFDKQQDGGGICVRDGVRQDNMRESTWQRRGVWKNTQGRWPANFYLDEEAARRLGQQSGERKPSGTYRRGIQSEATMFCPSQETGALMEDSIDTGTAARFFFNVNTALDEADPVLYPKCELCLCHLPSHDTMSGTQKEGIPCRQENASGAEASSSRSDQGNDSVPTPVQQQRRQGAEETLKESGESANTAAESSGATLAATGNTAQRDADMRPDEQLVLAVQSAANLCGSCATAIAQSLVRMQRGNDPASPLGLDSIPESKRKTLTQSLAQSVGNLADTDITRITKNQTALSGIVHRAIADCTENERYVPTRFAFHRHVEDTINNAEPVKYSAKASRKERDAGLEERPEVLASCMSGEETRPDRPRNYTLRRNPHPTVKPIDLTRWLATLLLPPAEYAPRRILVPFAGSGSEMIGAHLAGWEEIIGIEKDENDEGYVEIARARLEHWTSRAVQMALIGEG